MRMTEQTVFVVDDDPAARESVAALVESLGVHAETFDSAESFLTSYDRNSPGCLITDLRMMGMSGLELQQRLAKEDISLPAIVITAYADVAVTVRAMKNGAITLLEKPCREHELWESIRKALHLDSENRRKQARHDEIQARIDSLTPEEREVMDGMIAGQLNKMIASQLQISLRTVESRRHNVIEKMQVKSLAELVRLVVEIQRGD